MSTFRGVMQIAGQGGAPVPVRALVDAERLVLEVDAVEVGAWPLAAVEARPGVRGVVLDLDDDQVTIELGQPEVFLDALTPRKRRRRRPFRLPSLRLVAFGLFVAGLGYTALIFPAAFGAFSLLAGVVLLIVGYGAHSNPRVALRLPIGIQAVHVILGGLGVLVLGVALTLLG